MGDRDALRREARELLCDGKCVVTGDRRYHAQFCPSFDDSVVDGVAAALEARDREIAELRAKVAELEADRERLDWVAEHAFSISPGDPDLRLWQIVRDADGSWVQDLDLRAAIDAARRQEPDDAR